MKTFKCAACNIEKPISSFRRNPRSHSGYDSVCNICVTLKHIGSNSRRGRKLVEQQVHMERRQKRQLEVERIRDKLRKQGLIE